MSAGAITHHEMILLTQADLDGELSAAEAISVAAHRAGCAECRAAYRLVRAARNAVQIDGTRHQMPADARRAAIRRLEKNVESAGASEEAK